jgi:hypothetical protein
LDVCGDEDWGNETLQNKCWKEYEACWDKCPKTTDFDVDIEGAVVDEA